jgi:hypothetical protein
LIDFGGSTEPTDRDIYHTAAREFAEESGGLLARADELDAALNQFMCAQNEDELKELRCVHDAARRMEQQLREAPHNSTSYGWSSRDVWLHVRQRYSLFFARIDPLSDAQLQRINEAFAAHDKISRRLFEWVDAQDILNDRTALPLFIRLTTIAELHEIVREIVAQHSN